MRKKVYNEWSLATNADVHSSRNAILIIHGIGEQNPFETLDQFTRGFFDELNKKYFANTSENYQVSHRQIEYTGAGSQEAWLENYVSLDAKDKPSFDIYEYYWAHHMTGAANIDDIINWLKETSAYARTFYNPQKALFEENLGKKKQFEQRRAKEPHLKNLFEPTGYFHKNGYLKNLGYRVRFLIGVYKLIRYLAVKNWPIVQLLYQSVEKHIGNILINYLGDVVVYTSMDRKATHNAIRTKIINQAILEIESILKNDAYGSVFVAGHSLGSVVAYDVLNRLHTMPIDETIKDKWQSSLDKIKGLITFGSPLDKIAFFFRQQVKDKQHIRRQILNNLHCFKKSAVPDPALDNIFVEVKSGVRSNITDIKWINYYHPLDPVSGSLDLYDVEHNVLCQFTSSYGKAHLDYWEDSGMYSDLIDRYQADFVKVRSPVSQTKSKSSVQDKNKKRESV